MKSDHLPNAPLVELAVEAAWGGFECDPRQLGDSVRAALREELTPFEVERLVPEGAQVSPGTPVSRILLGDPLGSESIVLTSESVNISCSQPYESWIDFRPTVLKVLGLVGNALAEQGASAITQLTIRYLDAFGEEYWADGTPRGFLAETIGVSIKLPERIEVFSPTSTEDLVFASLERKLGASKRVQINLGEATVNGSRGLVFDISVQESDLNIDSAAHEEVCVSLDGLQRVAHDSFMQFAAPVLPQMMGE